MILSWVVLLKVIAIAVAGLMVGNELAVALFFHPRIRRLNDSTHFQAAQALAKVLGSVMPFWYALTFLLSLAVLFSSETVGTVPWGFSLAAVILFGCAILLTISLLVPINNLVARLRLDALPENWRELRARWDSLHTVRVIILVVALLFLIYSIIVGPHG
jgi:hypothetical protein